MIWGENGYKRKKNFVKIEKNLNPQYYTDILCNNLIHTAGELLDKNWAFQPDNEGVHSSTHTKLFLKANDVEVLGWSAKFSDINVIENV